MLVVGLGNPGPQYELTRHNVGFLVVDDLVERAMASWSDGRRYASTRARVAGTLLTLLKPYLFMNRSGEIVADRARFFRALGPDLVVVHDDLDLSFGQVRIKRGGGLAGHNGLRSIVDRLGTDDFVRVRVGIGKPEHASAKAGYVLARFTDPEIEALPRVLSGAVEAVETYVREGLAPAQNLVHGRDYLAA